jgi:F0F1-type ATP synthase membrane subunit c/vacuolar-type H+-ATPase subunit K
MQEAIKLVIGIAVLGLGIPIGNFLAKWTKEELRQGQAWFKTIILICMIGAIMGLVLRNDSLLFSLLFIAIVTSRSLLKKSEKKR